MEFNFPGTKPVISSQMLHITCPGLQPEHSLFDKDSGPAYDSVTLVSGMCLFTRKILDESISGSRLDTQELLEMQPTLYEVERIAGLSSAIADIAALIFFKYDGKCHVPLNIILDLPTWHYYQSIEDQLQHRGHKPTEVMDWIEAIMRRSQQFLKAQFCTSLIDAVFRSRSVSVISKFLRDQPWSMTPSERSSNTRSYHVSMISLRHLTVAKMARGGNSTRSSLTGTNLSLSRT
jgi:hypothetical protein